MLSRPGGSLLLCGPAGCGRRTCVTLLAYMHNAELFSPKLAKAYDAKAFRGDLKDVMRKAGVEGRPVVLFLEDHHLLEPCFLEYTNSLLSGWEVSVRMHMGRMVCCDRPAAVAVGEGALHVSLPRRQPQTQFTIKPIQPNHLCSILIIVVVLFFNQVPGLWTAEELAKELTPLEEQRKADAAYAGPPDAYAYFLHRVSANLHVVVSLDPGSEEFRGRLESNPALLTRCAIHWSTGWSREGQAALASSLLEESMNMSQEDDDALLIEQIMAMHSAAGPGATPRHFASFVGLYAKVFGAKRKQLLEQQNFLRGGLQKLSEAAATVDSLQRRAEAQRQRLSQKQSEADTALAHITSSMEQAADRRREVEGLRNVLEGSQVRCSILFNANA